MGVLKASKKGCFSTTFQYGSLSSSSSIKVGDINGRDETVQSISPTPLVNSIISYM